LPQQAIRHRPHYTCRAFSAGDFHPAVKSCKKFTERTSMDRSSLACVARVMRPGRFTSADPPIIRQEGSRKEIPRTGTSLRCARRTGLMTRATDPIFFTSSAVGQQQTQTLSAQGAALLACKVQSQACALQSASSPRASTASASQNENPALGPGQIW
jgi:hypothetical protein